MRRRTTSTKGTALIELVFAAIAVSGLLVVIATLAHRGLLGVNTMIQEDARMKKAWTP